MKLLEVVRVQEINAYVTSTAMRIVTKVLDREMSVLEVESFTV